MTTSKPRLIPELSTEKDLLAFDSEIRRFRKDPGPLQYVVEPRIAAVEVALIYEQGALRSASTRTGPVTISVKTILTVPLTFIPLRKETIAPTRLEITADVYMETEALSRLNQERATKKLPAFSTPRAAVEDSLYQTDPRVSVKRPLNYFCSGAALSMEIQPATHYEFMIALQGLGLRVNRPHIKVAHGIHEMIEQCRQLREAKGDFPYPVEGARVRVNSLEVQRRLSRISERQEGIVILRF